MRLQLLVGPAGLPDPDAAEYYEDLVGGARVVAAGYGAAAWDEPDAVETHLADIDGDVVARLRRSAAHLAILGRPPAAPRALFDDEVVAQAWNRGPEHVVTRRGGVVGVARTGAYDHFLHHTGEPLVYSPADFAPVVKDNAAPGGLVPSAPRLAVEVDELARALRLRPDDSETQALHQIGAAARAAVRSRAALITEYV